MGSLCSHCQQRRPKEAFTQAQLKKSAAVRRCKLCSSTARLLDELTRAELRHGDPLESLRTTGISSSEESSTTASIAMAETELPAISRHQRRLELQRQKAAKSKAASAERRTQAMAGIDVVKVLAVAHAAYEEGMPEDAGHWMRVRTDGRIVTAKMEPQPADIFVPVPWISFGDDCDFHWDDSGCPWYRTMCTVDPIFAYRLDGKYTDTDEIRRLPVVERKRIEKLIFPAEARRKSKRNKLTLGHLRQLWDTMGTPVQVIDNKRRLCLLAEQAAEGMMFRSHLSESDRVMKRQAKQARISLELNGASGPHPVLLPVNRDNVMGGQVCIYSLATRPALNGRIGRVESYNADGKRRFGVRVDDELLSIRPSNLQPHDGVWGSKGWCKCTSTVVCEHLRESFASAGIHGKTLVDWTALSEDPRVDPAHLFYMGMYTCEVDTLHDVIYYVQQTERNRAFFLCHRELVHAHHSPYEPTCPYLFFHILPSDPTIVVPPAAADNAGELPFIIRFCHNLLRPAIPCTVCLQEFPNRSTLDGGCAALSSGSLPCCHPICSACLKSLFPLDKRGCECPTCNVFYPNYSLIAVAAHGNGSGVMLAEHVAERE